MNFKRLVAMIATASMLAVGIAGISAVDVHAEGYWQNEEGHWEATEDNQFDSTGLVAHSYDENDVCTVCGFEKGSWTGPTDSGSCGSTTAAVVSAVPTNPVAAAKVAAVQQENFFAAVNAIEKVYGKEFAQKVVQNYLGAANAKVIVDAQNAQIEKYVSDYEKAVKEYNDSLKKLIESLQ